MLEVGKLYSCSEYYLLLYPDNETAWASQACGYEAAFLANRFASDLSRRLGKAITYCDPETPLLVLNVVDEYIEVLAGEQKMWIIDREWAHIRSIA
jgi:hypothetical protein